MAYSVVVDISGQTGAVGQILAPGGITFAQIFTGVPQFYPGSLVQVQELLEIQTSVVDEKLVGFSNGWFQPKKRLGTYQIAGFPITTAIREGDDGYLTNEIFEISRVSWYTITANPGTAFAKHEQLSLDTCNWYLVPDVYLFPDNPVPQVGQRLFGNNPALLGSTTLSKAPLADTDFFQKIRQIGLYLAPGVEGVQLEYKVAVINDIYTDYEAAPVPTCEFLAPPDCDAQYAAWLQLYGEYATQAECESATGQACFPFSWNCSTDETDLRQTWKPS